MINFCFVYCHVEQKVIFCVSTSVHCVPGRYELNSNCELCPAGTYKSIAGNQECTDCPEKSTTGGVIGAISTSQCDTGTMFFVQTSLFYTLLLI